MFKPNFSFLAKFTPRITKKTGLFFCLILLATSIAGISYYKYLQAKQEIAKLSTPEGQQQVAQRELTVLLTQIKKHLVLPDNETPTLATITDIEAIKKVQPFFDKAQNGDKVLVYAGSKKAIIYRPQADLIVNVGFIAVDGEAAGAQTPPTATTPQPNQLTLEIRNGTQTPGLGQKLAEALKGTYSIQKVTDAKKKDYAKTTVIIVKDAINPEVVKALAQELGADLVTTLPDGEANSAAEVIVIVGGDKVGK
jgi:hypothetical protein